MLIRMNKHKILVISSKYQPEYSGSGFRAHNTYKRLKKKYNLDFDVLTNSTLYQGNERYEYDGVEVSRISPPFKIPKKKSLWKSILTLLGIFWEIFYSWKFIRKKIDDYNLLHTFGNTWTIGFLSWYFSKRNKPIIRELCNDMSNPLYPIQIENYMRRIFEKENTLIVSISKKLEILARKFGAKSIWQRPNPVDEKKFFVDFKKKYFLRNKLTKFNQDDIVLNLVANFIDRKNQLFVLDVLSLLPKNFKLILAGPLKTENNAYFQNLLDKINNLNLDARVDIQNGFIHNFDEYLKCSDVFLFPSKAEGLGTPILESQACGVPVVSNYLKDITDSIIRTNKGGCYLKLDANIWAEQIQKVLEIPKEVLIHNAKYINDMCSTKIIDTEYYKRINLLTNNKIKY